MIDLSIIVTVYNVENYLKECLESIYKLNIKKEIILVNDESPDNSYLIINEYKKKYPCETIVINQKNKGLSGARNTGLKRAKGEYIAFIDGDDFLNSDEYENFFSLGRKKKLDIIIGTTKKYENGNYINGMTRHLKLKNMGITTGKKFFEESIKLNSFKEEVCDDIYRREFLIKNKLEFKEKLLHEDTLFSIQVLNLAERVEYFDIPFYIYRQREGSIMSTLSYKNQQHRIFIIKELIEFQKKNKIKGLNKYSIDLLWIIFRGQKEINLKLLNRLVLKERYPLKNYLKILMMYVAALKCKNIELIKSLEES